METDKKNYSTVMFTKDEHKDELLRILNDSRIQAIMPESIRGKAGKMLLWMARYMKCQLELGLLDEYQKPVTFNDIGALYYRLERSYETWEADLCVLEEMIKRYVDEYYLSDFSHPYHFKEEIKDDKILLNLEINCPKFNFGSLTGLLHKLEGGDCSPISVTISDNRVQLSWCVTATKAYASSLREWENVHKSFENEGVASEEVDPEFPEEDPPGGDIISELEIMESEPSDPTPEEMEHINAEADKIDQIICLYKEGYSVPQLSELYGISCQEIREIIHLNVSQVLDNLITKGSSSTTKHPDIKDFEEVSKTIGKVVLPVSYKEIQKIIKLYSEGYSIRDISEILVRSKRTVSRVLKDNGIEIRIPTGTRILRTPFPKEKEADVVEDYLTGYKNSYIQSKWSISQKVLYRILRDYKVELRMKRNSK